jgi:hypothetical protein
VEAGTIIPTDDELAARRAEAEADGPNQLAEPDDEPTGIASSTQLERPGAGGEEQISLFAGGEEPTTCKTRLAGGAIVLPEQFEKGQRIVLRVEAIVREVDFVDLVDGKTGEVNATERRHKATITGTRLIES